MANLLSLTEELLVQHILAQLDPPTLRSCSSTCRRLNLTIKSSALSNYLVKLKELSLVDNPAVSYDDVPLARRIEMLREIEERPGIRWQASAAVLPRRLCRPRSIKGEANVLCIPPDSTVEAQELHWTALPSKEDQAIEWNISRPSNRSARIAAHALSIEENDLFAFATLGKPHARLGRTSLYNPLNFCRQEVGRVFPIQIHLMQHSTRLPYPGLRYPIMDICAFQSVMGDDPIITLAICGTNLAVMVGHESLQEVTEQNPEAWIGHLSVWNWKTGEKKCEAENIPDKDMGIVFLKEDVLLHASSLSPSLKIYHIPTSPPSAGYNNLPLVECLGLPRLKDDFYEPLPEVFFNLNISFADNPTVVSSFAESFNPTIPRLFTSDKLGSILTIKLTFTDHDEDSCTSYLFVTHHQTLLDLAERGLSRGEKREDPLRWEEWGPDVTQMFWYDHGPFTAPFDRACGSRLFIRGQSNNFIEVYDFGRAADNTKGRIQSPEESQTPSTLSWIVDPNDPECQGNWFLEVVHTKLPFVRPTFKGSIEGGWDTMYVDQSRIVGIKDDDRIDVLYIG